jgi:ATP phosphoribosyltransferase
VANDGKLILALPKGRILKEVAPLLAAAGVEPESDFYNPSSRKLRFETSDSSLDIIRVRSFDVATFVAFGAAHLGVAGNDVLMEFDYSVAEPADLMAADNPERWSYVRVATKYPNVTRRHFAARGVHAECIKLNGAMELAPNLGLCRRIVDLVESGETLKANGLVEVEQIASISSQLTVNRAAWKTRATAVERWLKRFREAVHAVPA